jgi:hypothetical protein
MNEITTTDRAVREIICQVEATKPDTILQAYAIVARVKELGRDMTDALEERMQDVLAEQPQQSLTIETVRYYLGMNKSVKCKNHAGTLGVVLETSGGDLDKVVECLSSGAWKYGAVRVLLEEAGKPDAFDELFTTEEKPEVREGKPAKSGKTVQIFDKRFQR